MCAMYTTHATRGIYRQLTSKGLSHSKESMFHLLSKPALHLYLNSFLVVVSTIHFNFCVNTVTIVFYLKVKGFLVTAEAKNSPC